ncbi:MAG: septum formation initiator family protein [Bacteroidales bacterium]|nr:septum formation initiator family protein [Bacteroidales bacterium]
MKGKFWLNKYFIAFFIFFVWILFFDKNNLIYQWKLKRQINELKKEEEFYRKEIQKNQSKLQELQKYPERYVKFIREKYMFKKDNEDIFVLVYQKSTKKE